MDGSVRPVDAVGDAEGLSVKAPFDPSTMFATSLMAAWQRAAADSLAAAARDPRLMRVSTGLLRAQLLGMRAWQAAMEAAFSAADAVIKREGH